MSLLLLSPELLTDFLIGSERVSTVVKTGKVRAVVFPAEALNPLVLQLPPSFPVNSPQLGIRPERTGT